VVWSIVYGKGKSSIFTDSFCINPEGDKKAKHALHMATFEYDAKTTKYFRADIKK